MPEVYKHDKHKARWPGRAYLLYLLAMPLVPALIVVLFMGSLSKLLIFGGAFASFIAAARFMRKGLVAEAEFNKRKIARASRTPLKAIGSMFAGLGTFICSWLAIGHSLPFAAVIALLAFIGSTLFYGRDPAGSKLSKLGSHGYTTEEIIATLKEAESKILGIDSARRDIRNAELTNRLRRITQQARKILGLIEDDPGDIRRARKFLNVYLDGARRVTEGYARSHRRGAQVDELEGNFRNVLNTIEGVFEEQHQKLLEHDKLDLDVQIEVLSTQLKKEGVI
ncbi:MAG: 5-bromo-4-chloroindolyl phosphate hydrolysis family protein [Gammaproteobacteria bacterium]|nr:5-bromo-4-chloroindolyl phosphate hydrolysis family protein [Gammaproteobacteria bacterium]NNF61056.1 5-bromo-4-chloroindolyl phosphate hydrolase [Gammaproteobacteria bacterium]NNM21431.1 5-bromo-4-chloroindolyl phosphate hydrolase [Gammaproteobacteria bacterium]